MRRGVGSVTTGAALAATDRDVHWYRLRIPSGARPIPGAPPRPWPRNRTSPSRRSRTAPEAPGVGRRSEARSNRTASATW